MALKLRKEMKKSSYYVWFLGAKEARGLRGPEAVMPALEHLMQRERDTEPHKVTLQVSQKGLKIVQNVVRETGSGKSGKPKLDTVKHLIPSDSVAYAHQRDDIVVCVLLLMNPVTGWPLHVHAYRCDSLDTARLLHHQLQTLSDRPDNQKRWREVESKIMDGEMKEMGRQDSSLGSDAGASSARGSDSGEERSSGGLGLDLPPVRTSILYDSVAAELRARLGGGGGQGSRPSSQPLLLPPRDYDTVHRQRGNLQGIELRRCLNTSIVGRAAANNTAPNTTIANGSAASSGIGSDHASPSPDSPPEIGGPFGTCDGNSTSDEEWNADTAESTMYLMPDGSPELTLPRPHTQTEIRSSRHYPDGYKPDRYPSSQNSYSRDASSNNGHHENKYSDNMRSLEKGKGRFMENPLNKYAKNFRELEEEHVMGKNGDSLKNHVDYQVQREFEGKREILKRDLEKKDIERREFEKKEYERKMYEKSKEVKDFDKLPRLRYGAEIGKDDEFKTEIRNAVKCRKENNEEVDNRKPRYNFGEEYITEHQVRNHPTKTQQQFYQEEFRRMHQDFFNFKVNERYERRKTEQERENDERYYQPYTEPMRSSEKSYNSRNHHQDDGYIENTERPSLKRPDLRQRTPSPLENVSPKDRFKDAKEKFLLMEKERLEEERIRGIVEPPISPTRRDRGGYCKDDIPTSPSKRYNHFEMQEKEKYYNSDRYDCEDVMYPKPAPRKHVPHQELSIRRSAEAPIERYRMTDKYDPKRRSMFNLTEEEHRRTCNEIAKELKRKSYIDYNNGPVAYDEEVFREADRAFHELPESERYTRLEQQQFSRSSADLDRLGEIKSQINHDSRFLKNQKGKNRHSYAEPKLRTDRNNINRKQYPEMIQRTNSSLSNNGRVGLASVHPY